MTFQGKQAMSRDTVILPRKLDWMLTDRVDDLKIIMNDNATFINFPPIGSSNSLITVYGDNRVNILRTIRSVMTLVCFDLLFSRILVPIFSYLGMSILCCIIVALANAVQCSLATLYAKPCSNDEHLEANL